MDKVEELDYDAIVVMLPILRAFDPLRFNGNLPKDETAQEILINSGFLPEAFKVSKKTNKFLNGPNSICTHGGKLVDSEYAGNILMEASKMLFGQEKHSGGAYGVLVELMKNTHNHAAIKKEGEQRWWLSVNHDAVKKVLRFSFVDYGVGIFKSLNSKKIFDKERSEYHSYARYFLKKFGISKNADSFKKILEGVLRATISHPEERGHGLPQMYETLQRNQISNLFVVTNDVCADIANDSYLTLKNPFSGTFVYFELSENNYN